MTERRAPTIQMVAEAAGVGVGTVSRVLNDGYVSDELEARVRKAMRQLKYAPSQAARNLKLQKTGIVGLVAASLTDPWMSLFLSGLEQGLAAFEASVTLTSLLQGGKRQTQVVERWIRERRVDSLIFVRATEEDRELVEKASLAGIPHVHVSSDVKWQKTPQLYADNRAAGRSAALHLLGLGHREFAFIGGPRKSLDSQNRLLGLRALLAAPDCWGSLSGEDSLPIQLDEKRVIDGQDYSAETGLLAAERFLNCPHLSQASALICANDAIALGMMRGLLQAGVKIPEEVSIIGFDDVPAADLTWPSLTSISQPIAQMGIDSAQILLGEEAPIPPPYPTQLIPRRSTGPKPQRTGCSALKK